MAVLNVMLHHKVPCIPINSKYAPLSSFTKMKFTDELDRNDANLRKKYWVIDDEIDMSYAWLRNFPKFIVYPLLSLVRSSEMKRILHDCPSFQPMEHANAVIQGVQGFALVEGNTGPFMKGTDTMKRRNDFMQFFESKEASDPIITRSIVFGLGENPFLNILLSSRT